MLGPNSKPVYPAYKSRALLLYQPARYQQFGGTRFFQTHQTTWRRIPEECETRDVDQKNLSAQKMLPNTVIYGGGEIGCSK